MSWRLMQRQKGFGAIAAIVILVILALLAGAIVSFGTAQQMMSAQDVLSARAWQTARAGNEWGVFKALKTQAWTATATDTCDTGSRTATLTLMPDTGFNVTVTCDSWNYNEGEDVPGSARTVRVYRITAVACPAVACPAANATVAGAGYVERRRVVVATSK